MQGPCPGMNAGREATTGDGVTLLCPRSPLCWLNYSTHPHPTNSAFTHQRRGCLPGPTDSECAPRPGLHCGGGGWQGRPRRKHILLTHIFQQLSRRCPLLPSTHGKFWHGRNCSPGESPTRIWVTHSQQAGGSNALPCPGREVGAAEGALPGSALTSLGQKGFKKELQ